MNETCEPKLLSVIHLQIMSLFSEQFPEKEARDVFGSLDKDLGGILFSSSPESLRWKLLVKHSF